MPPLSEGHRDRGAPPFVGFGEHPATGIVHESVGERPADAALRLVGDEVVRGEAPLRGCVRVQGAALHESMDALRLEESGRDRHVETGEAAEGMLGAVEALAGQAGVLKDRSGGFLSAIRA